MGKRAIERAAQRIPELELQLVWKPFQLDPRLPASGKDKMQHYLQKFGPSAKSFLVDPNNMLNTRGKPMGIEFVYHEGSKVFNSFNAHKLLAAAGLESVQKQNALMEVYFRQYFKEGKSLGLPEELIPGAVEAGMSEAEVRKVIDDDHLTEVVGDELANSHAKVRGVPHFYFPGGGEISGGESTETFERTLRAAMAKAA